MCDGCMYIVIGVQKFIPLKEDLLESLNINYKVQLTSDFTPVEKQEEIIEELPKEDIEINSETVKWI